MLPTCQAQHAVNREEIAVSGPGVKCFVERFVYKYCAPTAKRQRWRVARCQRG
jgi:hypothetical protein